jgi:hypothetical protein
MMNKDEGNWWQAVSEFQDDFGMHMGFHYTPWSKFKVQLGDIGQFVAKDLSYKLKFPSIDHLIDYKLRACLSISDVEIQRLIKPRLVHMYENLALQMPSLEMTYESELVILQKN